MGFPGHGAKIACDAVIRRINDKDGLGLRMPVHRLDIGRKGHAVCDPEFLIDFGRDEYRHGSGDDKGVDDGLVGIAGKDDFVLVVQDGEEHRKNAPGRPIDGKEAVVGMAKLRHQVFALLDDASRIVEIVKTDRGVGIIMEDGRRKPS